eukprot:5373623-Pyramimonas_sp.AAC.1
MPTLVCAHRTHFGAPLTRFVAPWGAPPKAQMPAFRMRPPRPFWHTPHTVRGLIGSPTECGA